MRLIEIGTTHSDEMGYYVEISPEYRKAMQGLEYSTYVQILWWFDKSDNEQSQGKMVSSWCDYCIYGILRGEE